MASRDPKCDVRNCKWIPHPSTLHWSTRKCSSCFSKDVHESCCRKWASKHPDGNFVFCSSECCERGPILKLNLNAFKAHCLKLNKNALKCALRSIPLSVFCPVDSNKNGQRPKKNVELPKREMLKVLLRHRIQMEDPEASICDYSNLKDDSDHDSVTATDQDKKPPYIVKSTSTTTTNITTNKTIRSEHKCEASPGCLWDPLPGTSPLPWPKKKCSSCFSKYVHPTCCEEMISMYMYNLAAHVNGDHVFCSPECCQRGPILQMDPTTLQKHCQDLSKNAVKSALRSIPLSVYCSTVEATTTTRAKHYHKKVELKKSEMITALVNHRKQQIDHPVIKSKDSSCNRKGRRSKQKIGSAPIIKESTIHHDGDDNVVNEEEKESDDNDKANKDKKDDSDDEDDKSEEKSKDVRPNVRRTLPVIPPTAIYVRNGALSDDDDSSDSLDDLAIFDEDDDDDDDDDDYMESLLSSGDDSTVDEIVMVTGAVVAATGCHLPTRSRRKAKRNREIVESLTAMMDAHNERARKRVAILQEQNRLEEKKLKLRRRLLQAREEFLQMRADQQSRRALETRLQVRLASLDESLARPGLSERDRALYTAEQRKTRDELLEALCPSSDLLRYCTSR